VQFGAADTRFDGRRRFHEGSDKEHKNALLRHGGRAASGRRAMAPADTSDRSRKTVSAGFTPFSIATPRKIDLKNNALTAKDRRRRRCDPGKNVRKFYTFCEPMSSA
jgi:hypothetical protein